MTSISHAIIGASIAAVFPDPKVVIPLCILTHFACDIVPHWDLGTNWRLRPRAVTGMLAAAETLTALFGTFLVFQSLVPSPTILAIAIIASLLPDWLEVPYYLLLPKPPKLFYYIYKFQSVLHTRAQRPIGIITQFAVVGGFFLVGFVL